MESKKIIGIIILSGTVIILFLVVLPAMFDSSISFGIYRGEVALVEIIGTITSSRDIIDELHRCNDEGSIKAIVLRIDSPGGIVAPAQEIYRELTKVEKKVVVSMGSIATSGGYYIACAADWIFANPGTLTGGIGTMMQFPKIEELSKKIGIDREVVKSSNYKDAGSIYRRLTPEEKKLFQETVDDVYDQFVNVIFDGRRHKGLTKKQIEEVADARVLSGKQALEKKLIDGLGNLDDAIEYAGKISGIKGKPRIVKKEVKRSLLERMLRGTIGSELDQILKDQISLRYEFF